MTQWNKRKTYVINELIWGWIKTKSHKKQIFSNRPLNGQTVELHYWTIIIYYLWPVACYLWTNLIYIQSLVFLLFCFVLNGIDPKSGRPSMGKVKAILQCLVFDTKSSKKMQALFVKLQVTLWLKELAHCKSNFLFIISYCIVRSEKWERNFRN